VAGRERTRLRLADLLAALSLETDLAMGHPPEHAMRVCLLATRLAAALAMDDSEIATVYHTTLLRYVGCTAFSHEEAALFGGDDLAVRRGGAEIDFGHPREVLSFFLVDLPRGRPVRERARIVGNALTKGKRVDLELKTANCEVAARVARRLGLDETVQDALYQIFERWDGRGGPRRLSGDAVALASRIANVAHVAVVSERMGGVDMAVELVRRRAGGWLDPSLAPVFTEVGAAILREIGSTDAWNAVLEAEPEPREWVPEARLDDVARAFADVVDLKSPFFHGHSSGVAALAERAAANIGLPDADVTALRRAGLLHDLGRVGVPTGIWEKPAPLTETEWERVRLHAYHTERILSRSPALAPLAPLAGMHHERLDGSGYHRGAPAAILTGSARLLAAADVYHALTEPRPHRPAHTFAEAASELRSLVATGKLDADAASAVLDAAGQPGPRIGRSWPAGLTDREVEVVRLLAAGASKKQIAARLFISPSTVHTHVVHIYEKAGVATRAALALFAMEHDLIHS
jgi:HD-GYP domain-containing protein (c-di-GMP phosphodiesterase class II)